MSAPITSIWEEYLSIYPGEADNLQPLLTQLMQKGEDTVRSRSEFDAGHITAAAFILNSDLSKILLVDHGFLGKRIQPGGHSEPEDISILDTARREAQEETGLSHGQLKYLPVFPVSSQVPFHIDVHGFPARPQKDEPEHLHYDFEYVFIARDGVKVTAKPDESDAIQWVLFEEFAAIAEFAVQSEKLRNLLK
jgi:8-oxo-dGTP pyrophosphatase MutT (NUDIX family)